MEGENSAQNVVCAATMAGGRAFTATSSYGLVYMYDAMFNTAGYRAPVVMINVNREPPGIHAVCSGQQDMISVRDTGWVQLICENCQEIMDTTIMAFRLAEDYDIQLPVIVNYDGYYLSFLAESVEIPAISEVDSYLEVLKSQPPRPQLLPGSNLGCGSHGIGMGYVELRKKHMAAMERVKTKLEEIEGDFEAAFGRSYGGQIEEYRTEDADIVLVTSGSAVGTAREVIDAKRDEGIKVGLVKLRLYRPVPHRAAERGPQGQESHRGARPQHLLRLGLRAVLHGDPGPHPRDRHRAHAQLHRRPGQHGHHPGAHSRHDRRYPGGVRGAPLPASDVATMRQTGAAGGRRAGRESGEGVTWRNNERDNPRSATTTSTRTISPRAWRSAPAAPSSSTSG